MNSTQSQNIRLFLFVVDGEKAAFPQPRRQNLLFEMGREDGYPLERAMKLSSCVLDGRCLRWGKKQENKPGEVDHGCAKSMSNVM